MKHKIQVDYSFAPGIGLGIYYLPTDNTNQVNSVGIALPFLIIEIYLKRKNK